jgi:hypothetical protein
MFSADSAMFRAGMTSCVAWGAHIAQTALFHVSRMSLCRRIMHVLVSLLMCAAEA